MVYDLNMDIHVPAEDGTFISETHARIAEILKDYDPDIDLLWIPPANRMPGDKPFAVAKTEPSGKRYIICYADECDERLLARIWSMDASKHNIAAQLDAATAAREALRLKKEQERLEEAHDMAATILKSPLHTYRHGGKRYA